MTDNPEIDLNKAKDEYIESLKARIKSLVSLNETLQESIRQLTEHNNELRQQVLTTQVQLAETLELAETSIQMCAEWRARYEAATGTTGTLQ